MAATNAAPDLSKINIYDAVGLDRDATVPALQQQLHDLKVGWSGKAARQGSMGEQARSILALIDAAEPIFQSDATREEYDLQLRREPIAQVEDSKVDWVSRAWNYYFVRDSGAARVAARKAREQDAKDVMAWVVSAWIELLGGKDELRTAKNYADEAFVLDDQGTDTTDVYGVRGTVFHLQGDYDRALQTFDRALNSASKGEKPELLWRKALVFEAKRDYQEAFDTALMGLTLGVEIDYDTEGKLESSLFESALLFSGGATDAARISDVTAKRAQVAAGELSVDAKRRLLERFDAFLSAAGEIATKTAQLRREIAVPPGASKPDFPLIALGIAILNVLLLPVWSMGGGVVIIPILFILGFGGYVAYQVSKRSEATRGAEAYRAAQASVVSLRERLRKLEKGIPLHDRIRFEFESI